MGSVNPFSDLPSIDTDYEYAVPGFTEYESFRRQQECFIRANLGLNGIPMRYNPTGFAPLPTPPLWNDSPKHFGLPYVPSTRHSVPEDAGQRRFSTPSASSTEDGFSMPSPATSVVDEWRMKDEEPAEYVPASSAPAHVAEHPHGGGFVPPSDAFPWAPSNLHLGVTEAPPPHPFGHTWSRTACASKGNLLQEIQVYPDPEPEEQFDGSIAMGTSEHHEVLSGDDSHVELLADTEQTTTIMVQHNDNNKEEPKENASSSLTPKRAARARTNQNRSSKMSRPDDKSSPTAKKSGKPKGRPPKVTKALSGRKTKASNSAGTGGASSKDNFATSKKTTTCPHCSLTHFSKSGLNKHIATVHTRPFTCTFRAYGCASTFGSKNEWKRHVSSQHLRLGFWRCRMGRCYPSTEGVSKSLSMSDNGNDSDTSCASSHSGCGSRRGGNDSSSMYEEQVFNDFNRKDLFTQHVRRMHAPPKNSPSSELARFNASLEEMSHKSFIEIRKPPPLSVCGFCAATASGSDGGDYQGSSKGTNHASSGRPATVFEGAASWETRMEHVGRHLESGHGNERKWIEDLGLKQWLLDEGLIYGDENIGWHLVKAAGIAGSGSTGTEERGSGRR